MQYIVMDLEWNTAYCKKLKGFINEIIEIGAVKLDEHFHIQDEFSMIVKSQIGKKLHNRVKELTHISNEEIAHGIPFEKALPQFCKWIGEEENIFLSWGDGDIRTLIKNCSYFFNKSQLSFVDNYCDAQQYCQAQMGDVPASQQIGLSDAAEHLGINPDKFPHHRALDDSLLTVACLQKVFDTKKLKQYTQKCDRRYYAKLAFKPKIISDIHSPLVDKTQFQCLCDICGGQVKQKNAWKFINQSFRADFYCPKCKRSFKCCVRFKQYYDHVDVKRTCKEIVKVKAKENKEMAKK